MARGLAGAARPHVDAPLVAVFAGNHGVVAQGVSPFPQSVTQAMVANFSGGGAAINQICKTFDISLKVFELALEQPTGDITQEPALDEKACAATMAFGMEALASAARSAVPGRNGHRQHHGRRRDLPRALRRQGGGLGRPRHRRRRRRAQAQGGRRARGGRAPSRASWRSARSPASSRRTRNRRDRGRDPRRAHPARAGAARRLRRLLRGGGARTRSIEARSTIAWPATSRPRTPTPRCCAASARRRCSISACGSAKAPAPRSRSASSKAAVACHNGMATFAEAGVAGKE